MLQLLIQLVRDYGDTEPNSIDPEHSAVWQRVLTELWKDGITRHHIADELSLPREEVDTLLFGAVRSYWRTFITTNAEADVATKSSLTAKRLIDRQNIVARCFPCASQHEGHRQPSDEAALQVSDLAE